MASLRQFGLLKLKIQKILSSMAETLRRGDVAALPAAGAVDGCEYCDYRAVCGHEPDDPVRVIARLDAAQAHAGTGKGNRGNGGGSRWRTYACITCA